MIMVPFAAIRTVPIAALAWYRLQWYTWYRYSDISNFPHDIYINVSGIKEWLNQPHRHYAEKNEALLQLPELLSGSEYLGSEPDPKGRDYIIASHLFRTQIADDTSWIIVNETIWDDCWVHSVSDNIPDINEEQDLWTLLSGSAIRRGILKSCV